MLVLLPIVALKLISLSGNPLLNSFFKLAAGQHHAAITAQTAQPNIRADAEHLPAITAARMPFACLDNIANFNLNWFCHLSRPSLSHKSSRL
jgi:hypothetical protein